MEDTITKPNRLDILLEVNGLVLVEVKKDGIMGFGVTVLGNLLGLSTTLNMI